MKEIIYNLESKKAYIMCESKEVHLISKEILWHYLTTHTLIKAWDFKNYIAFRLNKIK